MSDNPYAAPQANIEHNEAGSEYEAIRREHLSTEASIKAVGALYLLGFIVLAVSAVITLISPIQDSLAKVTMSIMFIVALAQGIGGIGLRQFKPWARIVATVISVIGLIGFPFGTLISAYILYLMWNKKGRRVFQPDYPQIVAATPHIKYKTSVIVWIFVALILILLGVVIFSAIRT